jgi:GNAT superfamily N-acetyltransferase
VDIREIDPRDETLVRRHWEIGRIAEGDRPHDFYPAWESAWLTVSQGRDDLEMVLLGAFDGDAMWGAARIDHPRYDNLHAARAEYHVHPGRRRRGIGTALVHASYDVARSRDRRVVMTEAYAPVDATSPGLLFGAAMGFDPAIEEGMKVVDLDETAPTWDALADEVAPRHRSYRVVTWHDRLPDDYVEGVCRLNEMFFEEAPMGDLEVERETWTEERIRKREERNLRQHRHDVAAGALDAEGNLVAMTEIGVSDFASHRGFQSGTLVAPAHRGHSLGLAIKVANHRQLRELYPQCRVLLTGNADVNAPMNAVNERLGYREVERCIEMQRDV